MINYHAELVSALLTVLPTHYEMVLTANTTTPCISYMEIGNWTETDGDTLGYSRIQYQIKVWAHSVAEIQQYALAVDNVLRPLGFKRVSSNEMHSGDVALISKIMTYEALALETY